MKTIAIHRIFDPETRLAQYLWAEGTKVKPLSDKQLVGILEKSDPKELTVRLTSTSTFHPALSAAQEKGAKILTVHWHKTGLPVGLESEDIAKRFLELPEDIFSVFTIRWDLASLKANVQGRDRFQQFRKQREQGIQALERNDATLIKPEVLQKLRDTVKEEKSSGEILIEKDIAKIAKATRECIILNQVLGIADSWMTSAVVVAHLGHMSRFPMVSSLWHYCGYHVVDGKAPKRTAGQSNSWNPRVRTALWAWSDSMLKTKNPIWRPVYDDYLEAELAVHDEKHPGCKTKQGHCGARARRRVVKDVLKKYFELMNGSVGKDRTGGDTQDQVVLSPEAA